MVSPVCRVAAVSRCYRAETSDIAEEKGIYRVHQFTKVNTQKR
jgi:seryl-tRNA synthetase